MQTPVLDLFRPAMHLVSRAYFGLQLRGVENIPADGPLVITPNHQTYADPPLVSIPVRRRIHYMAWGALFEIPVFRSMIRRLRAFPVPVIAAVNGVAAGAGASLALGCDLVVAARSASFIQAFSKIGLVPDAGGTWLLPRLVGRAQALALALTGDKLPAEEAQRIGLIWKCVDDAVFADDVAATAARIAAMPVKALVATRAAVDEAMRLDFGEALAMEGRWQSRLSGAHDYLEGVAAFMAKRPAVFSDR